MKIYVLGICGTFMGGLAQLAAEKGIKVSGCDENVYPPMDQVLLSNGITIDEGYNPKNLPKDVDLVVVGNVIARGNPMICLLYTSPSPRDCDRSRMPSSA